MLNLAGSEYDFAQVVYAVLDECEHRRRSLPASADGSEFREMARRKLSEIRPAYDEIGGTAGYWQALEREVVETAIPQYASAALHMNALERNGYNVYRGGEPAARGMYALGGLLLGSAIIALPFVPTIENTFAFALTAAGFFYPDLVRYTHERRHARMLNGLVAAAANFQQNARIVYVSNRELEDSFGPGNSLRHSERSDEPEQSDNSRNPAASQIPQRLRGTE